MHGFSVRPVNLFTFYHADCNIKNLTEEFFTRGLYYTSMESCVFNSNTKNRVSTLEMFLCFLNIYLSSDQKFFHQIETNFFIKVYI